MLSGQNTAYFIKHTARNVLFSRQKTNRSVRIDFYQEKVMPKNSGEQQKYCRQFARLK
jgi:hypothetical protein